MQRDTKKNYQLYGRNDMIMLDEHNKIYGSLGLAEPYIVATKEGDTLLLDGAKDNEPFIGLSIYGKCHQNTVAGNQLLNPELFHADNVINGITFTNNHDGSVSVSGTATNNPSWYLGNYINVLEDGETYRISLDSSNVKFSFVIIFSDGRREYSRIITVDKSTMTSIMPYLQVIVGSTVNETVYPMLNKGSTALPWEPYTGGQPPPNPDYPQEIESVGDDGEIGVYVYGGNLLESIYGAKNGETVTGGKGNVNEDDYSDSTFVELPGYGHERVMQWVSSHTSGYTLYIRLFDKNKNCLHLSEVNYFSTIGQQNVHYTINVPPEVMYYCITGENYQCMVDGIMLNIGSTALPFEPYKRPQSLIVSTPNGLPGIPVSSGGNYTDENGQQWISDEIDFKRGKYVKRVRVLNAREERWADDWNSVFPDESGNTHVFNSIISNKFRGENAFCTHFRFGAFNNPDNGYDLFSTARGGGEIGVRASSELASTVKEWNQFIQQNDVIFACILKNPIETDLIPEQITAYQSLHTNYPTTTVMNDEGAGMKAIYKQIENGG